MTTRTGYLIKHTQTSSRYNSVVALLQGDVREDRRVGLCFTMLLGELFCYSRRRLPEALIVVTIPSTPFHCCKMEAARSEEACYLPSTLFYCCKMEVAKSVVFDWISYPPLILAFCSSAHRYYPFTHISLHM